MNMSSLQKCVVAIGAQVLIIAAVATGSLGKMEYEKTSVLPKLQEQTIEVQAAVTEQEK